MLKTTVLKIQIEYLEKGAFFVYAEDPNGQEINPSVWKRQLFIWHEESFYGSSLSTSRHKGRLGITIDGWLLLALFANESFSSLVNWEWDVIGQLLLSSAPIMHEAVVKGIALPLFTESEEHPLIWRLPQLVLDEFEAHFWEQPIGDATAKELLEEWYHQAMTSFLQSRPGIIDKIKNLGKTSLTAEELTSYFDEKRFRDWIGAEDERPFTIGLRISEPTEDEEPWLLETVLRDKNNPDKLISADHKRFPVKWKPYIQEITEEQVRWGKLFPWLSDSKGLKKELDEILAWDFLTIASEKLLMLGIEILLPSWWVAMRDAQLTVKARLKQTNTTYRPSFVGLNAMLDFDWRLSMNGADFTEEEFYQLVDNHRRLIKIDGQWIKLDPKMIQQIQELMKRAKKEGLRLQDIMEQELIPKEDTDTDVEEEFDPRSFANIKIELNRSLTKLVHALKDTSNIPSAPIPKQFEGTLRPYQQQGYNWLTFLRQFHFGAVLADDMGLGKTIQLITYLLQVKNSEEQAAPALIICPTSVLGNWQKELERFAPTMSVYLHYGPHRSKGAEFEKNIKEIDIVLTSYGLSHLDFDELASVHWGTIALDEAQNIKNAQTKQSRAIRKLKGRHHIALTGTPMENRLSELWSIFDFTNHGYLGTFAQFQKRFILPIEKEEEQPKISELQSLIRPFLLRRTKKDPDVELNLPDKLEQKEYCPLTTEQATLYEQLIRETFNQIEELTTFERKGLILQMLNRLKQLCNHPALYLKEEAPKGLENRSHKMEKLTELIESILDAKEACLIFTQYIGMGEMIQKVLYNRFGLTVPFLNGSMAKSKRDEYVSQFQNGEFPIFLLSLKAGGTGLNLTAANHVVHYDRWWNPAVENQATDRAYRIGQNRFVHVHKLIATGTLEEKIDAMLEKKQALNEEIINNENWITELSNQELRDLIMLS
ncbi:DEAD/DEAH box helicase [Bacillus sp. FJAT-49736]|uniref:DEAD/DEAH box helicase n=1 Tax=Bacillus sp. FJAT-49736 TaxID=2833582 RepID=UPI001BC91CDA|nr:DEAD/DEAH box helicase [Bacillus sp. FJAT-49736]MBS4175449.1 DEAD/DEAH box helicase [Bacillus sp. FJAT-49736]